MPPARAMRMCRAENIPGQADMPAQDTRGRTPPPDCSRHTRSTERVCRSHRRNLGKDCTLEIEMGCKSIQTKQQYQGGEPLALSAISEVASAKTKGTSQDCGRALRVRGESLLGSCRRDGP